MKRILALVLIIVLCTLVLSGCECKHEWEEATCEDPKTCAKCGETEGDTIDHTWLDATCEDPKTCEECEETEGEPLGHTWLDATCENPKTCEVCKKTEEDAIGHKWLDATCEAPKTCEVCAATEGEALGHQWEDATYSAPKTCSVCEETEGDPIFREDLGLTAEELLSALKSPLTNASITLEYWGTDEDGWPVYDVYKSSVYTSTYLFYEPVEDDENVEFLVFYVEDVTNENAGYAMGAVPAAILLSIDKDFGIDTYVTALSEPDVIDDVAYIYAEDSGLIIDGEIHEDYAFIRIYPA